MISKSVERRLKAQGVVRVGLTDEEIRESYADLCSACKEYPCIPTVCYESKQCIAKAQLKKVVEWLHTKGYRPSVEVCEPALPDDPNGDKTIGYVPTNQWILDWEDWQALLEEIE